jgi:hypothetical protein
MESLSTLFANALLAARDGGIAPRKFVWFDLVDGTSLGFWTGDEDVTIDVVDGDGNTVSRTYYGNDELKGVSAITYVSDFTVQTTTVTMSRIAPHAQTLLMSHDPRLASVEIHAGLMASARDVVDTPVLELWGLVDTAPVDIGGADAESSVALAVVSQGIRMLTRTNPAKRSNASHGTRRNGDEIYLYANAAVTWQRFWGEARK